MNLSIDAPPVQRVRVFRGARAGGVSKWCEAGRVVRAGRLEAADSAAREGGALAACRRAAFCGDVPSARGAILHPSNMDPSVSHFKNQTRNWDGTACVRSVEEHRPEAELPHALTWCDREGKTHKVMTARESAVSPSAGASERSSAMSSRSDLMIWLMPPALIVGPFFYGLMRGIPIRRSHGPNVTPQFLIVHILRPTSTYCTNYDY
jgi:hypothetical protein